MKKVLTTSLAIGAVFLSLATPAFAMHKTLVVRPLVVHSPNIGNVSTTSTSTNISISTNGGGTNQITIKGCNPK